MTDVDGCETDPAAADRVNALGTRYVAQGARWSGARLVHISTDYVFDGKSGRPYTETDGTGPVNHYGRSKLAGEDAVRETGGRWLIVRTSWVFGLGRSNFVTHVLDWAGKRTELTLVENKTGSPTYTRDLAAAIRHLMEAGAEGVYHASGGGACNWMEYGREILRLAGLDRKITPVTFESLGKPALRPDYTVLSTDKLKAAGFVMRDWREAVKEFCIKDLKG
jgi:dTDP-4-dehydrorhamnose reductase